MWPDGDSSSLSSTTGRAFPCDGGDAEPDAVAEDVTVDRLPTRDPIRLAPLDILRTPEDGDEESEDDGEEDDEEG